MYISIYLFLFYVYVLILHTPMVSRSLLEVRRQIKVDPRLMLRPRGKPLIQGQKLEGKRER